MSKERRAGTAFAQAAAEFLATHGHPYAERRALFGRNDKGDIGGVIGWVLECKATREIDLAGAVDEARVEARNAGTRLFAAVVKRRRKGIADAYVVMPLEVFAELTGDQAEVGAA